MIDEATTDWLAKPIRKERDYLGKGRGVVIKTFALLFLTDERIAFS
jgi:hypothetical protein